MVLSYGRALAKYSDKIIVYLLPLVLFLQVHLFPFQHLEMTQATSKTLKMHI
jgi:hypothetical protein